ncbi:MAG: AMP-binding protein [Lachnospiraceae bacterium]|nr:AMP-binding protein [Lachnospiraceae bacterium]
MNQLDYYLRLDYERWKDNPYLFEPGENGYHTLSFGEFIEYVDHFARFLLDKGLANKNIGIYSPNSINWMIADIAIMNYVGLSVGFYKDWTYENVAYAIRKCDIEALLYAKESKEIIDRLRDDFSNITFISLESIFEQCGPKGDYIEYKDSKLFTLTPKDENAPAKVVFTSGTTSFPKAVMLSLKNVFSGWKSLERRAPLNEGDVCYLFLPLNHTYGSIYNFIYSLVFGFKIYLAGSISDMAKEMMAVHPTVFSGVPLVFSKFYEGSKAMGISLSTLLGGKMKYLFCGGAKLDSEIRDAYAKENLYMMNAYALSETASAFCIDYPRETDYESVGTLFEDIEAVVLNPNEEGYGELAAKGDNIFVGYYGDEESTKAAFSEDGYFLTGDIGCIKDRKVYIKGRKDKKIILPSGEGVLASALEEEILSLHDSAKSVKAYLRDGLLTCDIYVDISNGDTLEKLWDELIRERNTQTIKYKHIQKFNICDIKTLLK